MSLKAMSMDCVSPQPQYFQNDVILVNKSNIDVFQIKNNIAQDP
jgi:hypothetical protein